MILSRGGGKATGRSHSIRTPELAQAKWVVSVKPPAAQLPCFCQRQVLLLLINLWLPASRGSRRKVRLSLLLSCLVVGTGQSDLGRNTGLQQYSLPQGCLFRPSIQGLIPTNVIQSYLQFNGVKHGIKTMILGVTVVLITVPLLHTSFFKVKANNHKEFTLGSPQTTDSSASTSSLAL